MLLGCYLASSRAEVEKGPTVMYLGPPYPGSSCKYRFNMRQRHDHQEIALRMQEAKAKCLLTTYDLPKTRELLADFFITVANFPAGMAGSKGRWNREIIVTNYDPEGTARSSRKG